MVGLHYSRPRKSFHGWIRLGEVVLSGDCFCDTVIESYVNDINNYNRLNESKSCLFALLI